MTEKEKDMMERYIYEVTRRVPKEQREEIRMELQELISDMMENDDTHMEKVLTELGNPREFAQKYKGESDYLIGPDYFEDYQWVMKIVLLSAVLSNLVSAIAQAVFKPEHLLEMDYYVDTILASTLISMVGTFGVVTFIFAVLERQKVKLEIRKEKRRSAQKLKGWSPAMLPSVPDKKVRISRGECVVGIVFTVLFGMLLAFAPEWFVAVRSESGMTFVSPFNMDEWNVILPLVLLSLGAGLIDEIVKLVTGRYCKMVMVSGILAGIVQIVLSVVVLKILPFWNLDFPKELEEVYRIEIGSKGDLLLYWGDGFLSNMILFLIVIITLAEVGTTVYKTLRYGKERGAF